MFKTTLLALALLTATAKADSFSSGYDDLTELPPGPYCPGFDVTADEQRAIFEQFTKLFLITGQTRKAFEDHVADSYIQHNPFILSGKKTILDAVGNDTTDPAATGYPANIITQAVDTDREIAYFHYYFTPQNGTQPSVTVDIFRMNGSCIEEHWDVSQDRPENATNPLAMFTPLKK